MIRTRIAPSPTGTDMHIGTVYTALINWAYAKKNNGAFIIRIEDTDRTRFVQGAEENFLNTLRTFGLEYAEGPDKPGKYGPYRQSERLALYAQYAQELVQKKQAYYCICTKERLEQVHAIQRASKQVTKYDRYCLDHQDEVVQKVASGTASVIRLKVPNDRNITFHDIIHGDITINTNTLDDQVLLKSDGFPTYHLAVVVDDHLMDITHIIRGEEWISSTPKHILLYEAFGFTIPAFAHVPLLRNPDHSKLSKRKNPVWASWFIKQGYLPDAVINYLSLMGWSHPTQKEIFSREEFVSVFDLKDMQSVGPAFDLTKLAWMNGMYIRQMDSDQLAQKITDFIGPSYEHDRVVRSVPLIRERIKTLSDYLQLCSFLFKQPKKYVIDFQKYQPALKAVKSALEKIDIFSAEKIGESMQNTAREIGLKNSEFFMMLRVAISGEKISPPLNDSMALLGKAECVARIALLIS